MFNEKEKIGITVSGGKDSVFVWDWAVIVCAGCRYGISNVIFNECKKMNIKKVINGASYLEKAPFKEYNMSELGNGNETRGLLKGIISQDEYLEKENLQIIQRDHFCCHEKDLSNRENEYGIEYIDYYDYIENNPAKVEKYVENNLICKEDAIKSIQEKNKKIVLDYNELVNILIKFNYDSNTIKKFEIICLPLLISEKKRGNKIEQL